MFAARAFGLLLSLAFLAIPATTAAAFEIHAPLPLDAGKLRAAKGAAHQRYEQSQARRAAPSRSTQAATVFGGLNKPGLGNPLTNDHTPSDSTGAMGPSHYVEMVNSRIGVFRRGDLRSVAQPPSLDTFIKHPGDDVFDPQIIWDPTTQRWYYLSDDQGPGTTSASADTPDFLAFGWSKTADPTDLSGGWCHFRINTDQTFGGPSAAPGRFFADYPKLGDNDTQLIFGTNLFDQGTTTPGSELGFVTGSIFTVPKPAAGQTDCPAENFFQSTAKVKGRPAKPLASASAGETAFTPVPANVFDDSTSGYVVAADSLLDGTRLHISSFRVDAAGAVQPPVNLTVAPYSLPDNAPQPGTSNTLDTLDGRLTQAVGHRDPRAGGAEAVWTQHTVKGPGDRSQVRWYELLPDGGQVRQQGSVTDPSSFAFNGAVSPASDGLHAALGYNLSGPSRLPAIAARSRAGAEAAGALGPALTIATSEAPLTDGLSCGSRPCRWGDYAAATPDPADTLLVWGSNQAVAPVNTPNPLTQRPQWKTSNFALETRDTPPLARLRFSPARPRARRRVRFDGRRSRDPDGRVIAYRWNFGGRQTSTGSTPRHVYGRPGRYVVSLTVIDDSHSRATARRTITVGR